jgi:hypothetical protein
MRACHVPKGRPGKRGMATMAAGWRAATVRMVQPKRLVKVNNSFSFQGPQVARLKLKLAQVKQAAQEDRRAAEQKIKELEQKMEQDAAKNGLLVRLVSNGQEALPRGCWLLQLGPFCKALRCPACLRRDCSFAWFFC